MKLLIITQVIDTEHPILGFFHRWVEEFAKHCEHVHVIALQAGKHSLPANVTVHSLGKEEGKGRLAYLIRFYTLIWSLRHDYDNVFVHMNQVYVLLGTPLWRLLGKRVGLWYAHGTVTKSLQLATKLTNHIFTCSEDSFNIKSQKITITGHGIDTHRFVPSVHHPELDLITVGRITPAKNLEQLIAALHELRKTQPVTLTIVGRAVTAEEKVYEAAFKESIAAQGLESAVHFPGAVAQPELPALLNRAKVFVTAAKNGSLDKAMLEPMACALAIVSCAPGSQSLPLGACQTLPGQDFVQAVQTVLESESYRVPAYRTYIEQNHSLHNLIPRILSTYSL